MYFRTWASDLQIVQVVCFMPLLYLLHAACADAPDTVTDLVTEDTQTYCESKGRPRNIFDLLATLRQH